MKWGGPLTARSAVATTAGGRSGEPLPRRLPLAGMPVPGVGDCLPPRDIADAMYGAATLGPALRASGPRGPPGDAGRRQTEEPRVLRAFS